MVKVYPSFSSEDYDYLQGFLGMIGNPNNPISGIPLVERENLENASENEIKQHLRPLIQQADIIVLLIGKNTHSRKWVKYEIDVALSEKIPIFAVKLPVPSRGGLPPLVKGKIELIDWDSRLIQSAIDRTGCL